MLDISSGEVNCASLCSNRARIQRHVKVHLNWLLFECTGLKSVELDAFLVPLEGMKSLWVLRSETTLDIVIDSKIAFDHICEVANDLICVFVKQSLQFRHFLIVIEVLFIL